MNEKTDFMRSLFSQQDFPQMISQNAAMHEDLRRTSVIGQAALVQYVQVHALAISLIPIPEMLEGLGRQLKPLFDLLAEEQRQRALVMSVFVRPKLHWRPHPAVRRLIDQVRREMRSQTQPQELNTIA
jgi:hypothetical protein